MRAHLLWIAAVALAVSACGKLDVHHQQPGSDGGELTYQDDLLKSPEYDFVFGKWTLAGNPNETLEVTHSRALIWTYERDNCLFKETGYETVLQEISPDERGFYSGGEKHRLKFMSEKLELISGQADAERCEKLLRKHPGWLNGVSAMISLTAENGKLVLGGGSTYEKTN